LEARDGDQRARERHDEDGLDQVVAEGIEHPLQWRDQEHEDARQDEHHPRRHAGQGSGPFLAEAAVQSRSLKV
jgi:hypothetical protein